MTRPWLTGDITSANSARHRHTADEAVSADSSGQLEAFRALASGAVASTNVEAFKVNGFDTAGELLDGRRLRIHLAGGDQAAGTAAFDAAQENWLTPRAAFEQLWARGEEFVYFAVNAGGRGVPRFGPFCVVVSDPAACDRSVAVFPGDTAQRYGQESPVDIDRVLDEAATWADRDAVAVTHLGPQALAMTPTTWPELICSNDRYLETVVNPSPPTSEVLEVRVQQGYLARLKTLRGRAVNGEALDPTELAQAHAYQSIQRWRVSYGTDTVEIP